MDAITIVISHYFHHAEEWAQITLSLSDIKPGEIGSGRAAVDATRQVVREQRVLLDFLGRMEHIRAFLESVRGIGDVVKEVSKADPTLHVQKNLTNNVCTDPSVY